jgi:hypothetical protein
METWANWEQYWRDIGSAGGMKTVKPAPKPDYIESGELRKEIEKLVARAVADAVQDTLNDVHKQIADIGMSAQDVGDAYDQVEEMVWKKLVEATDERNCLG